MIGLFVTISYRRMRLSCIRMWLEKLCLQLVERLHPRVRKFGGAVVLVQVLAESWQKITC
jgi:hypothetical protein